MKWAKKLGIVSILLVSLAMPGYAASEVNKTPLETRIVNYVKQRAIPAKQFLIEKVKENKITLLADIHGNVKKDKVIPIMREENLLINSIKGLKDVGLTHLAVELPEDEAKLCIEKYVKTGIKNEAFKAYERNWFWGEEDFHRNVDVIRLAIEKGIDVVYIERPRSYIRKGDRFEDSRDKYMAKKVGEIMHENKNAKMLIFIGGVHTLEGKLKMYAMADLQSYHSLGGLLDKEFGSYSIISEPMPEGNLPKEVYSTTEAVGFDVDKGPVKDLEGVNAFNTYGETFDGVIVFPTALQQN